MTDNTLDNHLAKKNLKQIFADIKKAGYLNSFMHQKGYIITKKTNQVKVRVTLDKDGSPLVTTMSIGVGELIFSILILIVFVALGGILLLAFMGYVLVRSISFLIALPKSREFKAEIEHIIR